MRWQYHSLQWDAKLSQVPSSQLHSKAQNLNMSCNKGPIISFHNRMHPINVLATNIHAAISLWLPVQSWQRGRRSLIKRSLLHASLQKDLSVQSRWQLSKEDLQSYSSIHIFYYPLCSFIVQVHLHWITLTGLCPPYVASRASSARLVHAFTASEHGTCHRGEYMAWWHPVSGRHIKDTFCTFLGYKKTILIYPAGHEDSSAYRRLTPKNGGKLNHFQLPFCE